MSWNPEDHICQETKAAIKQAGEEIAAAERARDSADEAFKARQAAFVEVMDALDLARSRAATDYSSPNCQGQRGQDRCDALYDAYHIVRKLFIARARA